MAELLIDDESVTISLSFVEKVESVHGDVTVPRSALTGARVVANGMTEVHGLRAPGTEVPGRIKVGTFRGASGTTFAVCHGDDPAVVLELTNAAFDRIVATVDDPEQVVRVLS
jgi:hypothetical protein